MSLIAVQTDLDGVVVESVERLYAKHARMDVPDYYEKGQENPWNGLVRIIPRKAAAYVCVPAKDLERVKLAQQLLKGVARRRKIRFALREKHEINYTQFAPAGAIAVLYV